jgi:hypothetical protein
MKLNFFKNNAPLFPLRWFIVCTALSAAVMVYCNVTGKRMFSFSNQQQWSSSGPGSHK